MGFVAEVVSADGHSHAGAAPAIRAHPGRNAVAERQQDFVCLCGVGHVLFQCHRVAVALDGLRLCQHGRGINSVCVIANELSHLDADDFLDAREICLCKITNRADLRSGQLTRRRAADRIQRAHRQRPELLRNFGCKQGVNLIWLFKIARHLRQQLIGCDADVDREAKLGENRVLDRVRNGDRVRIQKTGARHIEKALINGHLLHDGCEAAADGNKRLGVSGVKSKVRLCQNELRAFAQRHRDRFSGCNAELFCGDGFGKDHAGALVAVAADGGGNETKIWLSVRYAPRGFPG